MNFNHSIRVPRAFTLIELLVVIAVIALLAAIISNIAPLAIDKGKRSRAQSEIAAIELALQSYKEEQGEFPKATISASGNAYTSAPTAYITAGNILYGALRGNDPNTPPNAMPNVASGYAIYFQFKSNQVSSNPPYHMIDPYRRPYGYSSNPALFNAGLFDFWSTGSDPGNVNQWIKNWSGN